MKKAVGYARYSTDNQTENSIEYQLNAINEYCSKYNYTLIDVYSDEAKSGTNTKRDGLQRLLSDSKNKTFEAVIIYDQSRLSRNVVDWFTLRETLTNNNIQLCSCTEQIEDFNNNPNAFLSEGIRALFNQQYVIDVRKKSMAGVENKAKKGKFCGGVAPLGYDILNGDYVINETEARAVRTIFNMYADCKSYNDILNALNGVRGKRGQPLGKNSLYSILTNERYIGVYTWNKHKQKIYGKWAGGEVNPNHVRIENAIPQLIDNDIWERVQIRLKDNKKATNKAKREYLLSGLIECTECGATYVGHTSTSSKGYSTRYYCCGNKYRTHTCHAKNINADEIESFIVQNLKAYFLETDFDGVAQRIADMVNNASTDLKAEKKELTDINKQIINGMNAILKGMEFPELEEEIIRLRVRKSQLEDIIARNNSDNKKVDKNKIVELFKHSMETWSTDLKSVIKCHITKIYANTDGSYSVNVGVHLNGCGGLQPVICTTFYYLIPLIAKA